MAETISIDMLSAEIARRLTSYEQNIKKNIDISSEKVAKKAVKTLRATSPNLTGDYAKGWKYDQADYFSASSKITTVYNATDWQLTHLLEKGHALSNGYRSRKFEHIKPAEEMAVAEFVQEVKEAIENATTGTI